MQAFDFNWPNYYYIGFLSFQMNSILKLSNK